MVLSHIAEHVYIVECLANKQGKRYWRYCSADKYGIYELYQSIPVFQVCEGFFAKE